MPELARASSAADRPGFRHDGRMIGVGAGQAYAGFWIRLLARLIDVLIVGVPIGMLLGIQSWMLAGAESMNGDAVTTLIILADLPIIVGPPLYLTLLWSKRGATVGQGLLALRVADPTAGTPVTPHPAPSTRPTLWTLTFSFNCFNHPVIRRTP